MKELELEVYVRSYALGKTGIQWRKIENGESILGYPHILEQTIIPKQTGGLGTIEYVINYQKLSFVLMRHSQQLLFLVAGIEAPEERSNQLGSTIYNAVAWVVNPDESNNSPDKSNNISPENELMLLLSVRSLLSFVGRDSEFIDTINEAINFKGLEEFDVKLKKINQLTENSADKLKQLLSNLDNAEGDQQIWDKKVETIIHEQEIINFAEKVIKTELQKGDDLAILISKVDKNAVSVLSIDLDLKTEQSEVNQDQKDPNSASTEENQTEKPDQTIQEVGSEDGKKTLPLLKIKLLLVRLFLLSLLIMAVFLVFKVMKQQQEQPQQIPIPQSLIAPKPPVTVNLMEVNL
jgi:hypothetical protein